MFSGFMVNAWLAGTLVGVAAGAVGFFVVIRGASFAAHALPNGAFAGAAAATLLGIDPLAGLAVFAIAGAFAIAGLGRWSRNDVATALVIVAMLGSGALFLALGTAYSSEVYALLFGQILGVNSGEILPTLAMAILACAVTLVGFRPLILSSLLPDVAQARGVRSGSVELAFLVLIAIVTAMAVPVVGALLVFTLLVSPAAAARSLVSRPASAAILTVAIAVVTVWSALALAYSADLPVGFFVGGLGAVAYALSRLVAVLRRHMGAAGPASSSA